MKLSQIVSLYDQDQRKDIVFPDMRREVTPLVVRQIDTSGRGEGMVIYSRLNEDNADAAIREQVQFFVQLEQDFEWKVYDYDRPPDLKERLAAVGFVVEESEAIMVLDLAHAPENLWRPVQHAIERIHDPERLVDVQTVEETVWGDDISWVHTYLGGALRNYPQQMSVYVAYVDGVPASAAWIYFSPRSQFASLWGGSTVGRFRKQGLYTALLATRAQEARERRVHYLTVDASAMSRPILEKFNFQKIAEAYACKWKVAPKTKKVNS